MRVFGQQKIKKWVEVNKTNFPHFIILIGEGGSGKRTVAKYIASELSLVYDECEIRTEAVREVIDTAYSTTTNIMYCFVGADEMKAQAKNALLKITEEPPTNAYFCLTLCDDTTLLDTLKSRANVIYLENYNKEDIKRYYYEDSEGDEEEANLFTSICSVPGDVDLLTKYGREFYDYVVLVFENIAEVEPANAFKSSLKLALKNDEGYDLMLFWKVFEKLCLENIADEKYAKALLATCKYKNELNKAGVNKQQIYDMWVFDVREALMV